MDTPRRSLYRSSLWEIARPRVPLTVGHLLIRLTDPSEAFTLGSATDWLRCYRAAASALRTVAGAEHIGLMFAVGWHPLGDAVGEPVAESSTPTFHLFGRWPGERTTPAAQLLLPARRRRAAPQDDVDDVDAGLRAALPAAAVRPSDLANEVGPLGSPGEAGVEGPGWQVEGSPAHRMLVPRLPINSIDEAAPQDLLSAARVLQSGQASGPLQHAGLSCVVAYSEATTSAEGPSAPSPGGAAAVANPRTVVIHVLKRTRAEASNPLEELFGSAEVRQTLL